MELIKHNDPQCEIPWITDEENRPVIIQVNLQTEELLNTWVFDFL